MNLIKYTKYYFIISLLILVPGVLSLARYGVNFAIDFTGGTVIEHELPAVLSADAIKEGVQKVFDANSEFVGNADISGNKLTVVSNKLWSQDSVDKYNDELKTHFGEVKLVSSETIGP